MARRCHARLCANMENGFVRCTATRWLQWNEFNNKKKKHTKFGWKALISLLLCSTYAQTQTVRLCTFIRIVFSVSPASCICTWQEDHAQSQTECCVLCVESNVRAQAFLQIIQQSLNELAGSLRRGTIRIAQRQRPQYICYALHFICVFFRWNQFRLNSFRFLFFSSLVVQFCFVFWFKVFRQVLSVSERQFCLLPIF